MGRGFGNWDKSQRMQMKAFVCVMGLLLLLILFVGQVLVRFGKGESEEGKEPIHIPVVESFSNVWIMETAQGQLLWYQDGEEKCYPYEESVLPDLSVREQIADVVVTDGYVTEIHAKTEKINGKIISVDEQGILVEGHGRIPLAEDYKGYRIYHTLETCVAEDLPFGYDFADLVLEDGEICGILLVKEDTMENIRVLIKASDYNGTYHEEIVLTADTDFTIEHGPYDAQIYETYPAGEEVLIDLESAYFTGERVVIRPDALSGKITLKSVNRSQGIPAYRGHVELYLTEDGIAVVNELPLEEYLYSVVPSEMPASYPQEALEAQAICARTYAYGHMRHAGYPRFGAHVDDSTSYQVYNNILEQESTTTAVKESFGQLLFTGDGALAETFYYSTSCGVGTDANVWKTAVAPTLTYIVPREIKAEEAQRLMGDEETAVSTGETSGTSNGQLLNRLEDEDTFRAYISAENDSDFEVKESWYRWSYEVEELDAEHMSAVLQKRYQANEKLVLTWDGEEFVSKPVKEFTKVEDIFVAKRGPGGVCDELVLVTNKGRYMVISEHNIRYVLNDGESKVVRKDGKSVSASAILPSGFFYIDLEKEDGKVTGYTLTGGGFGHGVGMSQNAARSMAKYGMDALQILSFFYDGCSVVNVYEQ